MTVSSLTFEELFDPLFLARVQQFVLSISRAEKGGRLAEQRSTARGQGLDFADFKAYVPGDDLRKIDWNSYRRLGRLFVRVFEEQQDIPVHFLVDISPSMFVEEKPRIHAAQQLALALCAVTLAQHDSLGLYPFSERLTIQAKAVSGKSNLARVGHDIAAWTAGAGTDLAGAAEQLAAMNLRRGLVVVISDFFDERGLQALLPALGLLRHRLLLLQLVRPEDADPTLNPAFTGDLAIEDAESGNLIEVSITPERIEEYKRHYQAFQKGLSDFAAERGAVLARIDAGRDVLDQLGIVFGKGEIAL